jgi:hypothetical protein
MGKDRLMKKLFIIFLLPFLTAFTCSYVSDGMIITNITLPESKMVIEVERRGVTLPFLGGVLIRYTNIPPSMNLEVHIEEYSHYQYISIVTLTIDLVDIPMATFDEEAELHDERGFFKRILYVNEEAILEIELDGGRVLANIFIGEDRVDILDQRFQTRR